MFLFNSCSVEVRIPSKWQKNGLTIATCKNGDLFSSCFWYGVNLEKAVFAEQGLRATLRTWAAGLHVLIFTLWRRLFERLH